MTSHVVRTLLKANPATVVVVTRSTLIQALDLPPDNRVLVAMNDAAHSEMIDSIRMGLRVITEHIYDTARCEPSPTDGVLVVPADMPRLLTETCRKCIAYFQEHNDRIVIASHDGKRGHPMIFPFSMRRTVDQLRGGLNVLPEDFPHLVDFVPCEDEGVIQDIDTPEDHQRLQR